MKYVFIKEHKAEYRITTMCRVLKRIALSHYGWLKRDMSKQEIHRNYCKLLVTSAHIETKEYYGYERLHAHLTPQSHSISQYMLRSIKEKHGIYCKRHKRFKVTTNSGHNKLTYENVLQQEFAVTAPNQAWASDITYIWTNNGWLYLAGVKDLYTKEIIGYVLVKRMTANLVCNSLNMAIRNQQPSTVLLFILIENASIVVMRITTLLRSIALLVL